MTVLCGGLQGAFVAYTQAGDDPGARAQALQAAVGPSSGWVSGDLAKLGERQTAEGLELDFGVNVFDDGVTVGTNAFSSAAGPFEKAMIGLAVEIAGFGRRAIETVTDANNVTVSGPPMPAATGIRFATPIGRSAFLDGETGSLAGMPNPLSGAADNALHSPSSPFNASHVGTKTVIDGVGTREIVTYTGPSDVVVDGAAFGPSVTTRFTVATDIEPAERILQSAGLVIDSKRTSRLNAPTILRWSVG